MMTLCDVFVSSNSDNIKGGLGGREDYQGVLLASTDPFRSTHLVSKAEGQAGKEGGGGGNKADLCKGLSHAVPGSLSEWKIPLWPLARPCKQASF